MSTETIAGAAAETETATTTTTEAASTQAASSVSGTETTAATTAAASTETATLAAGGGSETEKPTQPTWPDDWRQKLAGEDKGYLKTLERFDSPAALAKAYREAQAKIASGQVKAPLAKDATPEQVAAWRAENGIPEKPDGYEVKPENGFVFGEADKPVLESFKAYAHSKNWTPTQLNEAATWYGEFQEQAVAQRDAEDASFREEARDTLRDVWGSTAELNRNKNAIQNLFASHGDSELASRFFGGRTADGRLIGDDPKALQFLARLAREINPAASVVPAGVANAPKAIDDEIASLKALMGDQRSEYWQGPKAAANQARYRELVDARQKLSARAA